MEAAEVGSGFDDPMSYSCHLRSDSHIGHALAISTQRIAPEISFELVPKTVLAQAHGYCSSHPKCATKPCVAVLRQPGGAAELARLLGREIESTELEELTMMAEAAQVAGLCKDRECQDGTDAGDLLKTAEIGVIPEVTRSPFFKLIAQLAQADHLTEHDSEHRNRF